MSNINIEKESDDSRRAAHWEKRAAYFFYAMLTALLVLVGGAFFLMHEAMQMKHDIEFRRLDLEKQKASSGSGSAVAPSTSSLPFSEQGENKLSSEASVKLVREFVTETIEERGRQGKSQRIPLGEVTSFLDVLIRAGGLSKEAIASVNDIKNKLIDAGLDVGVDTIKKITTKLLEDKPEEKSKTLSKDDARFQNNVNVAFACGGDRPASSTPAQKKPKQNPHPSPHMICPVPLVPFKPVQ